MTSRLVPLALLAHAAACAGQAAPSPAIMLDTRGSAGAVVVTGVPTGTLQRLKGADLSPDAWAAILRVSVAPSADSAAAEHPPAILGTYTIQGDTLSFIPAFPFDPGRQYDLVYDSAAVPGSGDANHTRVTTRVSLPADRREPSTFVTHVYPTAQVLPENQLRLYVHFSAPMGLRGGADQVAIVDDAGREVVDPFLPLDAEFWNGDRTRYTLFLDPGRVKRGILPHQGMGRALVPGRLYTLVVKEGWRDAHGLPLKGDFRMQFGVGPAIERPLSMNAWKIDVPAAGSRSPLAVTFPDPLDHGLLLRAMGIARSGSMLDGEIGVERGETRWTFTPREPWTAGDYELVALSFLEDLAGNRIGRAFEVDEFGRTEVSGEPSRFTRRFTVNATEQRAVMYLAHEVPRWRREHECYSCHNNGDAVRGLVAASLVPVSALTQAAGPYPTVAAEPFDTAVAIVPLNELDGDARPAFTPDQLPRAIERGRDHLARQQERDGSWVETTRPSGQKVTHSGSRLRHGRSSRCSRHVG